MMIWEGRKKTGQFLEIRTNKEILELYGEPSVSNVARVQNMRWLGHVAKPSQLILSMDKLSPLHRHWVENKTVIYAKR
jgi:hypothetical protein